MAKIRKQPACLSNALNALTITAVSLTEHPHTTQSSDVTPKSDLDKLLATNAEFKKAFKAYVSNIVQIISHRQDFEDYRDLLATEDASKIAEARAKCFDPDFIKSITDNNKLNSLNSSNDAKQKPKAEMQVKFSEQMALVTKISKELGAQKDLVAQDRAISRISEAFDIDLANLHSFLLYDTKQQSALPEEDDTMAMLDARLDAIVLPSVAVLNIDVRDKPLSTILSEIDASDISNLKGNIEAVKEYYDAKWHNKSKQDIYFWSINIREKLSDQDINEAIAIMDRANELVTGGHRLRDTQILSVLTFLSDSSKGHICQVNTGEGKTTIVSLLAVIKCLKNIGDVGKASVDVISSNPVLAEEGVKTRENFYTLFGLTVSTNNVDPSDRYSDGMRDCYKKDVVYGTIGNFQYDYLKDDFHGLGTRGSRKFQTLILDEVDSMTLDNAGHIAKLSAPLPGMESLKYVYINIWKALHQAIRRITEEMRLEFEDKIQKLQNAFDNASPDFAAIEEAYLQYEKTLADGVIPSVTKAIKDTNPTDVRFIPSHIKEYADASVDRWINSALDAKYRFHEDEQYQVKTVDGVLVIQPMDYANTGTTLKNTTWEHGLHQFLQLKHNLPLTAPSITSCFISNFGYINKYGSSNIYGLTGTLGSQEGQKLISEAYSITCSKIPTYKPKKTKEFTPYAVNDEKFTSLIAVDAREKVIKGNRATLIICETIKELKEIHELLTTLCTEDTDITIKTYQDEESAHIVDDVVDVKTIIIATNIAGRGTDFKTTTALEANGGLHVLLTFLPCNQRVEEQAFGRTGRQGNNGTVQLIVKKSAITELGVEITEVNDNICICDFTQVRAASEVKEKARLEYIKQCRINELKFNDAIFSEFLTLYKALCIKTKDNNAFVYVLKDLQESWAFWLDSEYSGKTNLHELDPKQEFKKFKSKIVDIIYCAGMKEDARSFLVEEVKTASQIAGNVVEKTLTYTAAISSKVQSILKGFEQKTMLNSIRHNPYYSIMQAEYFTNKGEHDNADAALQHAISITTNPEILYSAYMKLAIVAIERGGQYVERCLKVLPAPCRDLLDIEVKKDPEYKQKAREFYQKARRAIQDEKDHLTDLVKPENEDFASIIQHKADPQARNALLQYLTSKIVALEMQILQIDDLLASLTEHGSVAISAKIPNFFGSQHEAEGNESKIRDGLVKATVAELTTLGVNTAYALREVHDIPSDKVNGAVAQITAGTALICASSLYPPTALITMRMGATCITEGLSDIVMEVLSQGTQDYRKTDYIKSKAMTYCKALAQPYIPNFSQILQKASNSFRGIAESIRACKKFKPLCDALANSMDKLAEHLQSFAELSAKLQGKTLKAIEYEAMDPAAQQHYLQKLICNKDDQTLTMLGYHVHDIGKAIHAQEAFSWQLAMQTIASQGYAEACSIIRQKTTESIMNNIVTPAFESVFLKVIKDSIKNAIDKHIDFNKLATNSQNTINTVIAEVTKLQEDGAIKKIMKMASALKSSGSYKIQLIGLACDLLPEYKELYDYVFNRTKGICSAINAKLNTCDATNTERQIDDIKDNLATQLACEISRKITNVGLRTYNARDTLLSVYENYQKSCTEYEARKAIIDGHASDREGNVSAIRAYSDKYKKPVRVFDENDGELKTYGEEYGGDPIDLKYFPQSEDRETGHYAPKGCGQNWTLDEKKGGGDPNNCLYDAIAAQDGTNPSDIRQAVAAQMKANPDTYINPYLHDNSAYDGIFMDGGYTCKRYTAEHQSAEKFSEREFEAIEAIELIEGKVPKAYEVKDAQGNVVGYKIYEDTKGVLTLPYGVALTLRNGKPHSENIKNIKKAIPELKDKKNSEVVKYLKQHSITPEQAKTIATETYNDHKKIAIKKVGEENFNKLPQNQQDSYVMAIYKSGRKFGDKDGSQKELIDAIKHNDSALDEKGKASIDPKLFNNLHDGDPRRNELQSALAGDKADVINKELNQSTLAGLEDDEQKDIGWINHYFGRYTTDAIKEIASLRIQDLSATSGFDVSHIEILTGAFHGAVQNNIADLMNQVLSSNKSLIFAILNLYNKHAVGLIFERSRENKLSVKYFDSSGQIMPHELNILITSNRLESSSITQIDVEKQRYANCGPEVIENFVLYATGRRISQESAIEEHSMLVEKCLLGVCYQGIFEAV